MCHHLHLSLVWVSVITSALYLYNLVTPCLVLVGLLSLSCLVLTVTSVITYVVLTGRRVITYLWFLLLCQHLLSSLFWVPSIKFDPRSVLSHSSPTSPHVIMLDPCWSKWHHFNTYVWPCIIYENDEWYQLDATIMIYYHKYPYMFRTSICPSSGVQVVYCCMWCSALGVVAVVLRSRCVVLCNVCN